LAPECPLPNVPGNLSQPGKLVKWQSGQANFLDASSGLNGAPGRALPRDALTGRTKPLSTYELAERIVYRKMLAETDLTLLEAMKNGDVDHAMVQAEIAALMADAKGTKGTKGTNGRAGSKPQKGLLADLLIAGRPDRPKTARWFLRHQRKANGGDATSGLPEAVEGMAEGG
jgi:hypothetical protein